MFIVNVIRCLLKSLGINFISKLGTSRRLVTVKKECGTEYTLIHSLRHGNDHGGVRMKQAMCREWNYFEVTLTETVGTGEIAIGIGHEKYNLSNMPGWQDGSIGYHADDGGLFHEQGFAQLHGPTCTIGDRMGCGVDFSPFADGHVRVWFTKNDRLVFNPQTLELPVNSGSKFYPLICMQASGQEVRYMGHWQKAPPTEDDSKLSNLLFAFHTCTENIPVTHILNYVYLVFLWYCLFTCAYVCIL